MAEFHIYVLQFQGPCTVHAESLSHCYVLLGHLKRTESLLMLSVTLVLLKKKTYYCLQNSFCK